MVGAGPRALTILSVALGAGCAARHAGPSAPAVATASTPALAGPVYRFVSEGVTSATSQRALDAGAIGVISARGLGREIVRPDGSVEQAPMLARDPLMTSLPVPATLGGGYLFWNADALYRARSFLAPLEAVVALPTNVVGVEVGPSSVLVFLEGAPPRAFALDPPRQVPLSPHGVLDVASAGDGRALALDAAGRALASTDAGKSWREVTAALGAPVEGVREEGNEVAFTLSRSNGAWLQKDGQFVQRAFAPAPRATPEEKAAQLWRWAVAGGLPLPGGRALAGQGRGHRGRGFAVGQRVRSEARWARGFELQANLARRRGAARVFRLRAAADRHGRFARARRDAAH